MELYMGRPAPERLHATWSLSFAFQRKVPVPCVEGQTGLLIFISVFSLSAAPLFSGAVLSVQVIYVISGLPQCPEQSGFYLLTLLYFCPFCQSRCRPLPAFHPAESDPSLQSQCCCLWMPLLLKRLGAPVTTNATAILYQHPAEAAANDILCVSVLCLLISSSSGLNGRVVMCCHQKRRRGNESSDSRQRRPFLCSSLSPPGMLEACSLVCVCVCYLRDSIH